MSQEHEPTNPDEASAGGLHLEPSPFEPGYQPESLPKISVPTLSADAVGISAEALAQVPTLVDEVTPDVPPEQALDAESTEVSPESEPETSSESPDEIQDTPVQADTWNQELQVRMGKLNDEIQTLNVRLDELEANVKIKA
jgi:hypothetical protein